MTILRKTRIKPVSAKRRKRSGVPGKLGIVRLYGPDMEALRSERFDHDKGRCVKCGCALIFESGYSNSMELMHKRGKRNNGDYLEQVESGCGDCHRKSHNAGGKPCPPKR